MLNKCLLRLIQNRLREVCRNSVGAIFNRRGYPVRMLDRRGSTVWLLGFITHFEYAGFSRTPSRRAANNIDTGAIRRGTLSV